MRHWPPAAAAAVRCAYGSLVVQVQSRSAAAAAAGLPASRRRSRGCGARPRAALPPWMPCSSEDDAGDLRVVARREEHEPAVVAQVLGRSCRPRPRPVFEMTCAVPVLPETSWPAMRARPPVPAPLTTIHRPSRIACSFSGSMSTFDCGGGGGTGFQPAAVVDRLEQVRRDARAAVGERRHVDRHRHRRHRHLALADRRPRSSRRRTTSRASARASTRSTARAPAPRSADRCRSSRRGRAASPTC